MLEPSLTDGQGTPAVDSYATKQLSDQHGINVLSLSARQGGLGSGYSGGGGASYLSAGGNTYSLPGQNGSGGAGAPEGSGQPQGGMGGSAVLKLYY